jgi:hypothetical protein
MKMQVISFEATGEILQLHLASSAGIFAEQSRVIGLIPDQKEVAELHVTLAYTSIRAGGVSLPLTIEVCGSAELVSREDKTSSFLRCTDASQVALVRYLVEIEKACGNSFYDPARVFHVSLTNQTGLPRGSIAKVWEYEARQI